MLLNVVKALAQSQMIDEIDNFQRKKEFSRHLDKVLPYRTITISVNNHENRFTER